MSMYKYFETGLRPHHRDVQILICKRGYFCVESTVSPYSLPFFLIGGGKVVWSDAGGVHRFTKMTSKEEKAGRRPENFSLLYRLETPFRTHVCFRCTDV